MDTGVTMPPPEVVQLMTEGDIHDCQVTPQGSNYTYFACVGSGVSQVRVVYKPCKGEAPLWDFPGGTLYLREYLAYRLSEALGWGLVPYTIVRDGPFGVGSVQMLVDAHPQANYFTMRESHREALQRLCAYDVIANNADRKASHCLLGPEGRLWAIDHGITFHWEYKLRTVIWDFAGEAVPHDIVRDMARLAERLASSGSFRDEVAGLLSRQEVDAFRRRLEGLVEHPVFPYPGPRRSVPWPVF
ncbi:MAG: SCO1664 family protein [Chloroflexi bacterium]|nr:SCO1664 family protein [Chloroflexota bacterium]